MASVGLAQEGGSLRFLPFGRAFQVAEGLGPSGWEAIVMGEDRSFGERRKVSQPEGQSRSATGEFSICYGEVLSAIDVWAGVRKMVCDGRNGTKGNGSGRAGALVGSGGLSLS
jgi:hypothetical protein